MTAVKREQLRMMFGGRCAYCGCELTGKWHADHVEPVRRETVFVYGEATKAGFTKSRATGKLFSPQNDRADNLFPACVKCNILKGSGNPEDLRAALTYMAHSVPEIHTYSHVRHLMRFGKLKIDLKPVVFWFEQYRKEKAA